VSTPLAGADPAAARWTRAWAGRRRWPLVTVAGALVACGLVLLPLVFLLDQAGHSGWGEVGRLLLRHTTAVLLWNTVRLSVVSTALCALLGVAGAWCVERARLPWARVWAVALVLPLGIPDWGSGRGARLRV
jgi:iron(III) transport system permease protein